MVSFLLKSGIVLLAAGVALLLVDTFMFHENSFFSESIPDLFYLGGGIIVAGGALWLMRGFFNFIAVKKCPRCGKPVERNEIYCSTHLKQAINEYNDQMHGLKH